MKRKRGGPNEDPNPRPRKKPKPTTPELIVIDSDSDEEIVSKKVVERSQPKPPPPPRVVQRPPPDVINLDTPTPDLVPPPPQNYGSKENLSVPSNLRAPPPPQSNRPKTQRVVFLQPKKKSIHIHHPTGDVESLSAQQKRDFKSRSNGKYERQEIVLYIDGDFLKKGQKRDKFVNTMKEEFGHVHFVNNPINSSIMFARRLPEKYLQQSQDLQDTYEDSSSDETDESFRLAPVNDKIIIRIPPEVFIRLYQNGFLDEYLNKVESRTKEHNTMIILVLDRLYSHIKGMDNQNYRKSIDQQRQQQPAPPTKKKRKKKKSSTPYLSEEEARRAQMKIEQERERFKVFVTSSWDETARLLVRITKRVAALFYNQDMEYNLHSKYKETIKKKASNVKDAWTGFLREIPGVDAKAARTIVSAYEKPKKLIIKYRSERYTEKEKKERLYHLGKRAQQKQNLKQNPIGKRVSERIYRVFTERDGNKRVVE